MWAEEAPMKPIEVPALDPYQLAALEDLYRTTCDARLRPRCGSTDRGDRRSSTKEKAR